MARGEPKPAQAVNLSLPRASRRHWRFIRSGSQANGPFLLEPSTAFPHAVSMLGRFKFGGCRSRRRAEGRLAARSGRTLAIVLTGLLGLVDWCRPAEAGELPPVPGPLEFLHDFAGVLSDDDRVALQESQTAAFDRHGIPIVVVTIERLADHGPDSTSIEVLARQWFDHWGIGSPERNLGVLVLLAVEDRAARIELGAGWGGRADAVTGEIMDGRMVPRFRQGDFDGGLRQGVEALRQLASRGPDALVDAPVQTGFPDADEMVTAAAQRLIRYNPLAEQFGPWAVTGALLAGLGCLIAAVRWPDQRKPLLIAGLGLIVAAVFFWLLIVVLAIVLSRGRRSHGGFSGGGFSGGSSGGGGATGRW